MTAPDATPEVPAIHPDWDQAKVRAHLGDMRAERDRLQVIADAFQEAAEDAYRTLYDQEARLSSAEAVFAAPRAVAPAVTGDGS